MTRPRYETEEDRERENGVAHRFEQYYSSTKTKVRFEKLEFGHRADYIIIDDDLPVMYVEIKNRTCTSQQYDTYTISKNKLLSLSKLAESENVNAVLVVQWTDQAGYIDVDRYLRSASDSVGGRYDRNDSHDEELMSNAPISLFQFF